MAILNIKPWWSCDLDIDGHKGRPYSLDGKREYTVRSKVQLMPGFLDAGPYVVGLCPLLPLPGAPYKYVTASGLFEFDTQCLLTSRECEPQDKGDRQIWIVTDQYSTELATRTDNPKQSSQDPTYDLADISWDFETIQDVPERDLVGNSFLTSAQQPMSPPPTFPMDCPVVRVSRNELNFNYDLASFYARSINDAPFLGAPTGCVQCMPPQATQKNRGGFRYWRTTYKLVFRPKQAAGGYILPPMNIMRPELNFNGVWIYHNYPNKSITDSWQPRALMQGQFRLGLATDMPGLVGKPIPIFKMGHQVNHNVLLDPFGQESKAENPAIDPTIPQWFKEFIRWRSTNFVKLLVQGLS